MENHELIGQIITRKQWNDLMLAAAEMEDMINRLHTGNIAHTRGNLMSMPRLLKTYLHQIQTQCIGIMERPQPFRIRAAKAVKKAVELRLMLIESGKSKNTIGWNQCKKIQQDVELLQSDHQWAVYLNKNIGLLLCIIPASHGSSGGQMRSLQNEGNQSLIDMQKEKDIQLSMF